MNPAGESAKQSLAAVWTSPDSSATVLLAVAIDILSPACLDWEPETVREGLEAALDIQISQREMDRFLALRAALTSNMAYRDVMVFHHTMNALNGSRVVFSTWDPVDIDELAWGLFELMLNDKPASSEEWRSRFSDDVRRYVGVIAGDGRYAAGSLPAIIKSVADFGPMVKGAAEFADDPLLYGTAHENSVRDAQEAEDYAKARLDATMAALRTLPLSSRSPTWPPSAPEAAAGATQR